MFGFDERYNHVKLEQSRIVIMDHVWDTPLAPYWAFGMLFQIKVIQGREVKKV